MMIFWVRFLICLLLLPVAAFCIGFPLDTALITAPSFIGEQPNNTQSKVFIEQQICRAKDQKEFNALLFTVIEDEHLSIQDKNAFVLDLLFRGANSNAVEPFNKNSALMRAAAANLTRSVSLLLAHDARVDHRNKWGETVWHKIPRGEQGDSMRRLLEKPSRSRHEGFSLLSIKTLLGMLPSR